MAGPEDVVGLSVAPGVDLAAEGGREGGVPVMVRLAPPQGTGRVASDICCIVDVSGSMGTEAMLKTETGDTAGHGLSVLDVVKHSLKTIIMNLTGEDRLALVAYSNNAETIFNLTAMDDAGRTSTEQQLDQLQPSGMTNLWDGLKTGMELLKAGAGPGRLQHIMLFTDGLPNINPPRGILPMLKKLKDKEPGGKLPCTINTFGFGYELDSELLSQLAIDGCGSYNFIPDAGFVGTVFVNSMSNLLVTMAKDATLTLRPQGGASILGNATLGGHPAKRDGDALIVSLGSLQYGQMKDVVVQMSVPESAVSGSYLQATLEYSTKVGPAPQVACQGQGKGDVACFQEVEPHRLRLRFVDAVRQSMQACKLSTVQKAQGKAMPLEDARAVVEAMAAEIQASPVMGEEAVAALLEDATGQVTEALSREDWYTKWGIHYLPSLMFAHLTQQCNNFKDPGVQVYGGQLFEEAREKADETFLALPPPSQHEMGLLQKLTAMGFPEAEATRALEAAGDDFELAATYCLEGIPSRPAAMPRRSGAGAAAPAPAYSMRAYYDSSGPCFSGDSIVTLADGRHLPFEDLCKGDRVVTGPGGESAEVVCIVETRTSGEALLVELGQDVQATPWHPVQLESGEWAFPAHVGHVAARPCPAVYNVVLDRGHTLLVGGLRTVSLGHGFEGEVLSHGFWGGPAVLESLRCLRGWAEGRVLLDLGCVLRDEFGHACGLLQA